MNRNLCNAICAAVSILSAVLVLSASRAADLTWDLTTGGDWDTTTENWTGDSTTYTDGGVDNVTFNKPEGGTVDIQDDGVSPLSTTVSATSGTYTFAAGDLGGSGTLTKSGDGTLHVGQSYEGLVYSGDTQITGGVLQIDHNSVGGYPSDRSLGETTVLDGGTLRFAHTGAGHYNPVLSFTSGIEVTANGGTIDFTGGANNFGNNTLSAPSLAGDLTIAGNTSNAGARTLNFVSGDITLSASVTITNATGPVESRSAPLTVNLSPTIVGATRTLTLDKSGTGLGFNILGATSTSLDLGNLVVGDDVSLLLSSGNGTNPLSQIKANGGMLTMGNGSTLSFRGTTSSTGPVYDTAAIDWQGDGTLTFALSGAGNNDTYVRVSNGDLVVSSSSGLTQLNAQPWRAYCTIDSPYALVVGDGGTLNWTAGSQVREYVNGNVKLLDGATVVGVNSSGNAGGLIGNTGTLTLGDGTASTITVQGNHGTDTDSFNIGYADAVTDNGNATMKYANTSANSGTYFNVGWSNGGTSYSAPLVAFKETSGGTEFAPIAGSGGVAVVGAETGTVATFAQSTSITTAGTVGFYNEINTNQRGALGPVTVDTTGRLMGDQGTYEASAFSVDGTVAPGLSIGTLNLTGDTTFNTGSILEIEIAGSNPGEYDVLNVNGDLTFDDTTTLDVVFDGFTPGFVESWAFLTVSGTLNGLENLALPSDQYFISQSDTTFTLNKIPEPASALLLALAGLVMLRRQRRV